MNKRSTGWSVMAFVPLALIVLALSDVGGGSSLQAGTFDSPIATPNIPLPPPTPPMAAETYKALQYIAEREGVPWAVEDPALAQEIRQEYRRMGEEDAATRAGSLVEYLSERGFAVRAFGAMPSVSVALPKQVILKLAERDDVGEIFLIGAQISQETDAGASASLRERTFSDKLITVAVLWGLGLPLSYLVLRAGGLPRKRLVLIFFTTVMLLALFLLSLAACRPQEIELPFESIERFQWATELWKSKEPGLVVIASVDDLTQIDNLVTEDAQAQLRELDFSVYFAVAVFIGWHHDVHEGITIRQIIRRGNVTALYAWAGKRTGKDMATSPYHLIKVRKEGKWNREIRFTLYLDGKDVASLTHFIP
jgi:hypothetical protein